MAPETKQVRRDHRKRRQTSENSRVCTCDDPKPSSRLVSAASSRFPAWETFCTGCGCPIVEAR